MIGYVVRHAAGAQLMVVVNQVDDIVECAWIDAVGFRHTELFYVVEVVRVSEPQLRVVR